MKKKSEKIVQADTTEGQMAGEAVVEVIENQLRENDPPETIALDRLIALGESRENSIRYIASVFSIEIFDAMKNKKPYQEDRYVRNLNALPKLPKELE